MVVDLTLNDFVGHSEVIELYKQNDWPAANKPIELLAALRNSHSLVTARVNSNLVGLANAISDGHLVVYYPHLLVHPEYRRRGIGRKLMQLLQSKYSGFHQQILVADIYAIDFYKSIGFVRAGKTESMWFYSGNDHDA